MTKGMIVYFCFYMNNSAATDFCFYMELPQLLPFRTALMNHSLKIGRSHETRVMTSIATTVDILSLNFPFWDVQQDIAIWGELCVLVQEPPQLRHAPHLFSRTSLTTR